MMRSAWIGVDDPPSGNHRNIDDLADARREVGVTAQAEGHVGNRNRFAYEGFCSAADDVEIVELPESVEALTDQPTSVGCRARVR